MPFGGLLTAGIGAGASLINGFIGSNAASKAAKQLNQTGQQVAGSIDKATGQAIDAGYAGMGEANSAVDAGTTAANATLANTGAQQKDVYGNMTAGIQPYQAAGTYGLNKMQSQGDFSFNPTDMANEPGYQFQLAQGNKALQASAAGRGMLQSGSTLKSMDNYSQGLAGTSYQNAYNRALSTYDTNRAGYQSLATMGQTASGQNIQAGSVYGNQLTSLAGMGTNVDMTGAGLKSNVAMNGNEYVGNTGLSGAEASGGVRMQGAGAQASGTVGSANAWGQAVNGLAGAGTTYGMSGMNNNIWNAGVVNGGSPYGTVGSGPGIDAAMVPPPGP